MTACFLHMLQTQDLAPDSMLNAGHVRKQVMTIWGLGGAVGVIGGGAIGQWLHNRRRAYMPLFVGICVALAAAPIWFLIDADVGRLPLPLSFAAGFVGGALASPPGPNARCVAWTISQKWCQLS